MKKVLGSFFGAITSWPMIIVVAVLVIGVRFGVAQSVKVDGLSMMPNYQDKQALTVDTLDRNIQRGQVVAVYKNKELSLHSNVLTRFSGAEFLLKRVIGLPNEEIEIRGSEITIYNSQHPDGFILEEKYIPVETKRVAELNQSKIDRQKIPQDSYYVMGDNRNNSLDSRYYGAFPSSAILGLEKTFENNNYKAKIPVYNTK